MLTPSHLFIGRPVGEIALSVLIEVAIGAIPALILYLLRGSINARIRLLELACGVIESRGLVFGAVIAVSTVLDLVVCTAALAFLPRAAAFSSACYCSC